VAADRPVILQLSENAIRFHGGDPRPVTAALLRIAEASVVPVALHLDHVTDWYLLEASSDAGFSSVMFDAGALGYHENVAATARAAAWAHDHGLLVEAELGWVGGKESQVESAHDEGVRTDPDQAAAYVAATGVDALAVAVGSSHAMIERTAGLDLDLIASLHAAVPVPLVLHGSSGVPDDTLAAAVLTGMTKINIGTRLNLAFTGAVRNALTDESITDPRKYLAPARDAVAREVETILAVLSD
jgi:fructose-bisphosphate aldolase class II